MKACLTAPCILAAGLLDHAFAVEQTEADQKLFQEKKVNAENGDALAQFILGVMYAKGQDVPKDLVLAYKWWLVASAQGHEIAAKNHASIEHNLSPERRTEGQRMAREFKLR